jgi:hypothetical protein
MFFISGGRDVLRLNDFVLFEFVGSVDSGCLFDVEDEISIFKDFFGFSVEILLLSFGLLFSFSMFVFSFSILSEFFFSFLCNLILLFFFSFCLESLFLIIIFLSFLFFFVLFLFLRYLFYFFALLKNLGFLLFLIIKFFFFDF